MKRLILHAPGSSETGVFFTAEEAAALTTRFRAFCDKEKELTGAEARTRDALFTLYGGEVYTARLAPSGSAEAKRGRWSAILGCAPDSAELPVMLRKRASLWEEGAQYCDDPRRREQELREVAQMRADADAMEAAK